MGTSTPWGPSQDAERVAPGIIFYSTASHGGLHLTPALNAQVHAAWREAGGWYEEDLAHNIVYVTFPQLFTTEQVARAHATVKDWWPDKYERAFGVVVKPEESRALREQAFYAAHKADWLVISAVSHGGMVLCLATLGGVRRWPPSRSFLVPPEEYKTRGPFCFVIDEARHQEVPQVVRKVA